MRMVLYTICLNAALPHILSIQTPWRSGKSTPVVSWWHRFTLRRTGGSSSTLIFCSKASGSEASEAWSCLNSSSWTLSRPPQAQAIPVAFANFLEQPCLMVQCFVNLMPGCFQQITTAPNEAEWWPHLFAPCSSHCLSRVSTIFPHPRIWLPQTFASPFWDFQRLIALCQSHSQGAWPFLLRCWTSAKGFAGAWRLCCLCSNPTQSEVGVELSCPWTPCSQLSALDIRAPVRQAFALGGAFLQLLVCSCSSGGQRPKTWILCATNPRRIQFYHHRWHYIPWFNKESIWSTYNVHAMPESEGPAMLD